jgi:hypothetical protein
MQHHTKKFMKFGSLKIMLKTTDAREDKILEVVNKVFGEDNEKTPVLKKLVKGIIVYSASKILPTLEETKIFEMMNCV